MKTNNFNFRYTGKILLICSFFIISILLFQCSKSEHDHTKQLYTCGMHPDIISDEPGNCPICEMKLTPVKTNNSPGGNDSEKAGVVTIDPQIQQAMNVKTVAISRKNLSEILTINAISKIDERSEYTISSRVSGWINKLHINFVGQKVVRNQKVMEIYSPELVAAQQEYLSALQYKNSLKQFSDQSLQQSGEELLKNSYQKLRLLKMSTKEIKVLEAEERTKMNIPYYASENGFVIKKYITEGEKIKTGQSLLHIADLSNIWILGDIYERDISGLKLNDAAKIYFEAYPNEVFTGKVSFISPVVEPKTRTIQIRIDLTNPDYKIKPSMLARVEIEAKNKPGVLAIAEEALIRSGKKNIAVLALPENKFKPVEILIGEYANGFYEILSGLKEGDRLVSSAQFLIDSESNLKSALQKFSGHNHGMGTMADNESEENHEDHEAIDINHLDKNKDHVLYECPMDWHIISDEPGRCSICEMKLRKYSTKEVKDNLIEHGHKVKEHNEMDHGHLHETASDNDAIDVASFDKNKDGELYECPMDWQIISDKPERCSICEMKLRKYKIDEVKNNLHEHGHQVKH